MVTRPQPKVTRPSTKRQQQIGQAGEEQALSYLLAQGLTLIDRNFRTPLGELDLIMQDGGTIVFVEVRTRARKSYGGAAASVTGIKQSRMMATAKIYLARYRQLPPCRFDVIAIDGNSVAWLKNAIEE